MHCNSKCVILPEFLILEESSNSSKMLLTTLLYLLDHMVFKMTFSEQRFSFSKVAMYQLDVNPGKIVMENNHAQIGY